MLPALTDKMNGEGILRKFPLNWGLLLFLVLFLDVKLAIKVPVLVIASCLSPGFKWGFRFRDSRLPLFYPLMIGIALIDWILFNGFKDLSYDLVALMGVLFWLCCMVAAHQVRSLIEASDTETLHRTLMAFFILNALVSLTDMARIVWETKALNPYLYQGMYQKYFIRTGDYVKGLSLDTSTTNAMINAFGVVYFLKQKKGWMLLICMACMLATGSNFTNLLLLGLFGYLFIFDSDKEQKGGILLCLLMGAVFLGKVSPQNNRYTQEALAAFIHSPKSSGQGSASLKPEDQVDSARRAYAQFYMDSVRKAQAQSTILVHWVDKPYIPQPDINEGEYLRRDDDTTADQRIMYGFIASHREELPLAGRLPSSVAALRLDLDKTHEPGKWVAFKQVFSFLHHHPARILTGDGAGNFSSKLAFRSAGLGIMGGYPAGYAYINSDFLRNHLDVYLDFFARPKQMHSLTNSPDSVYGQVLGEYGVIGFGCFCLFYIGFFIRKLRWRSYSLPLLALLVGSFFIGFWFEQLSIVVLFEALFFTDIKTAS